LNGHKTSAKKQYEEEIVKMKQNISNLEYSKTQLEKSILDMKTLCTLKVAESSIKILKKNVSFSKKLKNFSETSTSGS
jgi:hypothetical protein